MKRKLVAATNKVRQDHAEVYGYRKVTEALRAMGITVNGKKVLRHLRSLGLTQPRKVKSLAWTHPALVKPEAGNTYWEAEFTYVWAGDGNAYLYAIIDAWDRDIVGDVFSDRCRAIEAVQALEKADLCRFGGKVVSPGLATPGSGLSEPAWLCKKGRKEYLISGLIYSSFAAFMSFPLT